MGAVGGEDSPSDMNGSDILIGDRRGSPKGAGKSASIDPGGPKPPPFPPQLAGAGGWDDSW
eukprot:4056544-Prorocentrum_lima.AAC.1